MLLLKNSQISHNSIDISLGKYNINEKSHVTSHKYLSPSQMRVKRLNDNVDEIDDGGGPLTYIRQLDMQLVCDVNRVRVIAPAAEPVVGYHHINVLAFHNRLDGLVVFSEIQHGSGKCRQKL